MESRLKQRPPMISNTVSDAPTAPIGGSSRGYPLRDAEGRVIRWYNLLTDIDERKQLEERLRRSEPDLLEAQSMSHTGSWRRDDGRRPTSRPLPRWGSRWDHA